MSKPLYFLAGLVGGIYADQTYKLPSLSAVTQKIIKYIQENEKKP
jgi:hypothetical protein